MLTLHIVGSCDLTMCNKELKLIRTVTMIAPSSTCPWLKEHPRTPVISEGISVISADWRNTWTPVVSAKKKIVLTTSTAAAHKDKYTVHLYNLAKVHSTSL